MPEAELRYAKIGTRAYIYSTHKFHKTLSFLTLKARIMGMIYNHKLFIVGACLSLIFEEMSEYLNSDKMLDYQLELPIPV